MRLTEKAHQYLEEILRPGDLAIDATAGNGHDCLKIAQLIAPKGQLMAIDRQASAIETSGNRLRAAKLEHVCEFIEGDHAEALLRLTKQHTGQASAIIFNLGYLPGSDKSIQTGPATTLPALNAASALLRPRGLLLVTAYRGHDGGIAEADAVARWMDTFPGIVTCHEPDTSGNSTPPILWVAKSGESGPTEPDAAPGNRPLPAAK